MPPLTFHPISANFAISLFEALKVARRLQLQPALSAAVLAIGVSVIDSELQKLVPAKTLDHVAALGLRGERVFPVPAVLSFAPPLIGYYRMLLGLSRKEFISRLKYGPWAAAEESGSIPPRLVPELAHFCAVLTAPLVELVHAVQTFDDQDLNDLALLTLGPTLQGGRNNVIGTVAASKVFSAISALIEPWIVFRGDRLIRFTLPSGRTFEAASSSDPDIRIDVGEGANALPLIAIEIKGGNDASNAHNRAGEAEKSHIKAVQMGYLHRWTVIKMSGVDEQDIRNETPSSTVVFEANDVIERTGPDWEQFQRQLGQLIGASFRTG